jgi:hypothetical protein
MELVKRLGGLICELSLQLSCVTPHANFEFQISNIDIILSLSSRLAVLFPGMCTGKSRHAPPTGTLCEDVEGDVITCLSQAVALSKHFRNVSFPLCVTIKYNAVSHGAPSHI